jgi:hypothetical protein
VLNAASQILRPPDIEGAEQLAAEGVRERMSDRHTTLDRTQ